MHSSPLNMPTEYRLLKQTLWCVGNPQVSVGFNIATLERLLLRRIYNLLIVLAHGLDGILVEFDDGQLFHLLDADYHLVDGLFAVALELFQVH